MTETFHLVKKKIEPDFYCFIQVDVDGTKKVERRKMCIEKVAQQKVNGDIRIVRRPFIPEEYSLQKMIELMKLLRN